MKNTCYRSVADLPLVLTPSHIMDVMGLSKNVAYQVVHSKGFPTIKVGKQYRIPRDKFLLWLDSAHEVKVA